MKKVVIISSSVREGRKSHRVALFFKKFIESNGYAESEILDLDAYQFPIFHERLKYQKNPPANAVEFAAKVKAADGVIIVTPEYNGGYPASIKNALDLLIDEWRHKPVAISTASDGVFGGSQVITSLQFSLWKIKALTVTAMFPVPKVQDAFDESGTPADAEGVNKRATTFIKELMWFIDCVASTSHS